LSWLPDDWPVVEATRTIDRDLKGSVVVEVLVDTGRENGLYDPKILETFDRLARDLERDTANDSVFVGKATSVADILKEIHQALNRNNPSFYKIPDNARLIPQEFLLFENSGSDDLEDVVDSTFRLARLTIKAPWRDALEYGPFLDDIESRFEAAFGDEAHVTATGVMTLFGRTLTAAIHSAARSYVIAIGVVTVLMILLIGHLRLGLLSMIPNIAPILMTLGVMGWIGMPLDMFTMLIGSIAIGLAVDDTIHFMHNFRRFFAASGDVRDAVGRTLHTTGRAMVVTSVVLCLGFLIFTFASMNNLIRFGWLTGLAIALALLADFVMAPALVALGRKRAERAVQPGNMGETT
jgi:predicted RND superfamily exporter protein